MGLFKSMKDMGAMVAEAPTMIAQANQLAANAQAMGAAQQGAFAMPQAPTVSSTAATAVGPDFEPVHGVGLEAYAEICRDAAAAGNTPEAGIAAAAARGVSASDWEAAAAGWTLRMQMNVAVGQRFNALYLQRH